MVAVVQVLAVMVRERVATVVKRASLAETPVAEEEEEENGPLAQQKAEEMRAGWVRLVGPPVSFPCHWSAHSS